MSKKGLNYQVNISNEMKLIKLTNFTHVENETFTVKENICLCIQVIPLRLNQILETCRVP